jgi:hypothetical protein
MEGVHCQTCGHNMESDELADYSEDEIYEGEDGLNVALCGNCPHEEREPYTAIFDSRKLLSNVEEKEA